MGKGGGWDGEHEWDHWDALRYGYVVVLLLETLLKFEGGSSPRHLTGRPYFDPRNGLITQRPDSPLAIIWRG